MDTIALTADEVAHILHQAEDYYTEFKGTDKTPASLTKLVAAFGNSSGGDIYIGIDEPERGRYVWNGFGRVEDANAHVAVLMENFPPGDSFKYTMLEADEHPGFVLHLEVSKTRDICTSSDGTAYRRAGAQVQAVRDDEGLRILRLQKGITSYENETLSVPKEFITDSDGIVEFIVANELRSEAEPWLRSQLMIVEDRPTVSGVVLFADEPQAALPKASVMVYRYATTAAVGSRDYLIDGKTHMIEGSAINQIRATVSLTTALIESVKGENLEAVKYPPETLHEIITNAIIHRDYSIKDNVHVRIFDDRVEVESPGLLPGNVTPRNILEARFSRNETIERMLHKYPDAPNKNVGEGFRTATDAMRASRLADPEVSETTSGVLVKIKHQRLDSPATIILNYLESHDVISNKEARSLTGEENDRRMRRVLSGMIDQGAIEQVPGTDRGGYRYRLPERDA